MTRLANGSWERIAVCGALVIVVYTALAYARKFSAGCGGACIPGGLEFAFLVFLEVLAAALIVSLGTAVSPRAISAKQKGCSNE